MRNRSQPTTLRDQDPSGRRIVEDIQKAYEVKKLILLALWAKGWSLVMYLTILDKDKIRSSGTPENSTSE